MPQLKWILLTAAVAIVPLSAQAGFILEGSLGSGYMMSEPRARTDTNIMLAPGYGLGEMLRLELGLVANMGDVDGGEFDLDLRPMLVIDPPLVPLYGRVVVGFTGLLHDNRFKNYAYGGAVGFGMSLAGVGVFAELGVIPRNIKLPDDSRKNLWVMEGRAGVYYAF